MTKKIISMLLVLCTFLTVLPMSIFAEEVTSMNESVQEEQQQQEETTAKKKITYVKNGGGFADGVMFATDFLPGEEVVLPDDDIISRPGHVFCGWYLDSDFVSEAITKIDATFTEDVILYAKWIPLFYTIVIPDEISADAGHFDINATVGGFFEGDHVDVSISSANDWQLISGNTALPYTVSKDGNVFTNGSVVATFDSSSSERFDCVVDTSAINHAGSYTDVLTFNVSFVGIEYTVTYETGIGDAMEADSIRAGAKFSDYVSYPTCPSNYIFAGWYLDSELTKPLSSEDVILGDTVLYAQYFEIKEMQQTTYQSYAKAFDQSTDFRILIETTKDMTMEDLAELLSLKNLGTNATMPLDIVGSGTSFTVGTSGGFIPGASYKLIIEGDLVKFAGYDENVKEYQFSIYKEEVANATLNDDVKYLQISEISALAVNGALITNITPQTVKMGEGEAANEGGTATMGSFVCEAKSFNVGDIVAVGEADALGTATDLYNEVTYIEITGKDGNLYIYSNANATDVLFTPDVLPVANAWDTDGDANNYSITVSVSDMDFSAEKYSAIGLSSETEIEVGDFIAFYDGVMADNGTGATVTAYARILTVVASDDYYVITYETTTYDEFRSAMDIYNNQTVDGDQLIPEENREALEESIAQSALDSGFADDAAVQILSSTFTPEAMEELGISSLSYTPYRSDRKMAKADSSGGKLTAKASISKLRVSIVRDLVHFEGKQGIRVVFEIDIKIVIGGKDILFGITLSTTIEQEIIVSIKTNCEAEWDWWGPIPYIKEYYAEASVDFYDYTSIGLGAIVVTKEGEGDDDDKPAEGTQLPLAERIEKYFEDVGEGKEKALMDYCNRLIKRIQDKAETGDLELDGTLKENVWETAVVLVDPNRLYVGDGSASVTKTLADQYAKMLGRESDWVNLLKKELYTKHILICYGIIDFTFTAEFVIQGNLNLYAGVSFWYENATRHMFTFQVFAGKFNHEKLSLVEERYEFAFYLVGTLGLRVGFDLSIKVGILTTDLASVGITISFGAYVKLYGYLHYELEYSASQGRTSNFTGAMYLDFGLYLEIGLKLDALKGNLEVEFDLFEGELPLLSAGRQMTAVDFAYEQRDLDEVVLKGYNNSTRLPDNLFDMYYLDLKEGLDDGEYFVVTKNWYEDFAINTTHPAIRFDAANKIVMVEPGDESVIDGEIIITWKGEKASFAKNQFERRIKIHWDNLRDGYYIAYDTAGGTNVDPTVKKFGEAVTPPENPTRRGYDFTGWYIDALCTIPYEFPATMPNEDTLVYAGWTPASVYYTVEHYTQNIGGNGYTLYEREKITAINGTVVTGQLKDYEGFTAPDAITATVTADSGMVIKYYYTRNTYKATFDYGVGGMEDRDKVITYYYGQTVEPPVFTYQGFYFSDWVGELPETMPAHDFTVTARWGCSSDTPYRVEYYQQNANGYGYTVVEILNLKGTTYDFVDAPEREYEGFTLKYTPVSHPISSKGNTVIKVYFDRNTHNVNYVDNGANAPIASETHRYGENFIPKVPTRTGYGFAGWFVDEELTTPFNGYMTNGDLTLYAKWEAGVVGYVVNHNIQNANNNSYTTTTVYGNATADTVVTPELIEVGEGFIAPETQTVTVRADGTTIINYYYTREVHTLTVDKADGSTPTTTNYKYGADVKVSEPTRTGYTFAGWDIEVPATMPNGDVTITAKWIINQYKITFNSNGGSAVDEITANYGDAITAPANPTRTGYTFAGWDITIPATMPAENLVATAKWTLNTYSITVNTVSGSIGSYPTTYTIESSAINIPDPTRTGYTFLGWTGTGLSGATKNLSIPAGSTGNRTYTATWSENTYTISYAIYGSGATGTAPAKATLKYSQSYTIPANPFTRAGYTFMGWSTSAGGSVVYSAGQSVSKLFATNGSNVTLYPVWKANTYTIKYANYASSGSVSSQSATYDTAIALRSNGFTRTGYTFVGWSLTSGGTKNFSVGQSVSNLTATNGGTVTLYPVWQANAYTVKYNANGGSGSMSSTTHTYDVAMNLRANGFSRSGYMFIGWSTSSGASDPSYGNGASVKNLTATNGGTVTLYAIWLDCQYYYRNSGLEQTVTDDKSYEKEYFMSNQVNISKLKQYGCTKASITISYTVKEVHDGYQYISFRKSNEELLPDGKKEYNTGGVGKGSASHTYTCTASIDDLVTKLHISLAAGGSLDDNWEFRDVTITINFY